MNILGPDSLTFGVDDVAACVQYLTDYGLIPTSVNAAGGIFAAQDKTCVIIKHKSDASLPPPLPTASMLRKVSYGVGDAKILSDIRIELRRDREVRELADGSIETQDDSGFIIGFQVSTRQALALAPERINSPGAAAQRPPNELAVNEDAVIVPRTLSHVVLFVPDSDKAEAFYVNRLGFRCTDRFIGLGPFLRPAGTQDHHTLFFIQTPPFMQGCEHFTFHVAGPTELMQAGTRFVNKGYTSFWGPGRHKFGSNWFWYFNSPLSCHVEYDADMDLHDDTWQPRAFPATADTSQLFLFKQSQKWSPGGGPPSEGAAAH